MAGIDNNTLLLLHGEEIIDSSFYHKSITNSGVVVSKNKAKFGKKSLYFNGSSTLSVKIPNSKNFTVDFWINLDRYSQYTTPVSWLSANGDRGIYWHLYGGSSSLVIYPTGYYYPKVTLNEWHHMAIVQSEQEVFAFLDGAIVSHVSSAPRALNELVIGALHTSTDTGTRIAGYIDELRVSNIARWTQPFIPPITPYSSSKTISVPFNSKPRTTFHARVYPINPSGYAQSEIETQTHSLSLWMNKGVPISSLPEGTIIQAEISGNTYAAFYVAEHNYEAELNGKGKTLLVSKYANGNMPWNDTAVSAYDNSALDRRLNIDWYNRLPLYVKQKILLTKIKYTIGNGNNTVSTMERKVFQPSGAEMGFHVGNMNNEGSDLPIATILKPARNNQGAAVNQHLRTPTTNSASTVWRLESNGSLYYPSATDRAADRPCFTVSEKTLVVKSSGNLYELLKAER